MGGIGCRLLFTLIIYCILLHVIHSLCRLVAAASARPCVSTLFYSITVFVPWWMVAARRVERTDSIILHSLELPPQRAERAVHVSCPSNTTRTATPSSSPPRRNKSPWSPLCSLS